MNKYTNSITWLAAAISLGAGLTGQAAVTDQQIAALAKSTYVFQTYLKNDDIDVESNDGVVRLTGSVAEDSHKVLAEATVMSLPGVQRVEDRLQSKAPNAPPTSDDWIESTLRFAFQFHRSFNPAPRIEVDHGVVTLTGMVTGGTEQKLAVECARGIAGVRGVVNHLTVIPTTPPPPRIQRPVDDASITAEARVVLLLHHITSPLPLEISTANGSMTVGGIVKTAAAKSLVTLLLQDLPGVTEVKNQLVAGG
jgi:osmotically-inducible protein OsmY